MCHVSAGGAISNMYSVMIARFKFFPEVKTKGMAAAPRLVLFTSEHVSPTTPPCPSVITVLKFQTNCDRSTYFRAESLLHQESQCSLGLWNWEPDPFEDRWEVWFIFDLHAHNLVKFQISFYCTLSSFSRGRVIPADLEAKVIDAKQKVNVSNSESNIVPTNLFIYSTQGETLIWSLLIWGGWTYVYQSHSVTSMRLIIPSAHMWCNPALKYLPCK